MKTIIILFLIVLTSCSSAKLMKSCKEIKQDIWECYEVN